MNKDKEVSSPGRPPLDPKAKPKNDSFLALPTPQSPEALSKKMVISVTINNTSVECLNGVQEGSYMIDSSMSSHSVSHF